jgi:hypothetical protein
MYGVLHALAGAPMQPACLTKLRALLYQQPRLVTHPVTPMLLCRLQILAGGLQRNKSSCQVIPQLLGWEIVEIPAVSSDTPSATSSPASLLGWLQQRLGGQSRDIAAIKIQRLSNTACPVPSRGYNLIPSNVSSPPSCATRSTVPWLIVCVVFEE